MKSKLMKVLHPLCGRTMIGHVLCAAQGVDPRWLVTVVGNDREQVTAHVHAQVPDALIAVQQTQEGTGHAVRVGLEALRAHAGTTDGVVVVMSGDTRSEERRVGKECGSRGSTEREPQIE